MVKARAGDDSDAAAQASAQQALRQALSVQLRLFAPFLPFVTEEVWSWWRTGSVHTQPWPRPDELTDGGDRDVLTDVGVVLSRVRKAKSEAKVGMRTEVESATIAADAAGRARIESAQRDLTAAGRIHALTWVAADPLDVVDVTLAPPPS